MSTEAPILEAMPRARFVTFHICPVPTRGVVTVMVAESGKRVHAGELR